VPLPAPDGYGSVELGDALRDPHVKAHVLLQAHLSRLPITAAMQQDQASVVGAVPRLLSSLADIAASHGWLRPALVAMELSQMVVQGLWVGRMSPLLQVPHFTDALVAAAAAVRGAEDDGEEEDGGGGVQTVQDLIDMDDAARSVLLSCLSRTQVADVARFCNRYPSVDVAWAVEGGGAELTGEQIEQGEEGRTALPVAAGSSVRFRVQLERESETEGLDEGAGIGAVHAPLFPGPKSEGWWLVVGNPSTNALLGIKRVRLADKTLAKFACDVPDTPGKHSLRLYLMSDSYLGCDQEFDVPLDVRHSEDDDS
jgi:pre-mRNA-splicing helicase BRR2